MLNVIEAIEKQLQEQKNEIYFKGLEIEHLRNKLEAAEKEIAELKGAAE